MAEINAVLTGRRLKRGGEPIQLAAASHDDSERHENGAKYSGFVSAAQNSIAPVPILGEESSA